MQLSTPSLFRGILFSSAMLVLAGCTKSAVPDAADVAESIEQLHCGQQTITTEFIGEHLQLTIGDQQYRLARAISASGARYLAEDDEDTSLWFKGRQATFVLEGMEYPLCAPSDAIIEPFRASGNEPFWSVTLNAGLLTLNRLDEEILEDIPYVREDGRIKAGQGDQTISLQVDDQLCRDNMSGMPFPQQVQLEFGGQTLNGCGGQPARLLQGVEWVVEDINAEGIIDSSRVTLNFETNGRINGAASCNRFMGQYNLTGESLTISQPATTMMACAPALMEQEQRVLHNLETLRGFDFDETGALLLRSSEGSFKAYAEQR